MQAAVCRAAVEDLVLLMDKPDFDPDRLERAMAHVEQCPHCTSRVGHLLQALATRQEDTLTCQECQELLPGYLRAKEEKMDAQPWWRQVAVHLSACPSCQADYRALAELAAFATGEQGAEPPAYPVPDLSFLKAEPHPTARRPGVRWWPDELGRLVVQLSDELLEAVQFRPLRAASTGLKAGPAAGALFELSLPAAAAGLAVTITGEGEPGEPDRCTLLVSVEVPGRGGWPHLAGSQVILCRRGQELDRQWTDAFGQAVFEGVEIAQLDTLTLEITPVGAEGKGQAS